MISFVFGSLFVGVVSCLQTALSHVPCKFFSPVLQSVSNVCGGFLVVGNQDMNAALQLLLCKFGEDH